MGDALGTLLQILGSLGIFLFGMKVMSEGIQKTAGDGMRRILAGMTRNRFTGLMTGFFITVMVQSSSASTVMVVSFVNAGLMTLVESIGVIMGANLGTTVTAWIIALTGFKFSLGKIALPIIGIAFPLFFVAKGRRKSTGEALIGFGLLFFGLSALKDAVPDVRGMLESSDPEAVAMAEHIQAIVVQLSGYGFGSVLLFLLFGIVLTLVVQSSSAAMAITVMLSINGWIGFEMGAAIVLGENIGTTVTAYLASLGANTSAKRAARAHFAFNIIGVIWMLAIFQWLWIPMIERVSGSLFPSLGTDAYNEPIGFALAIHHSLFNLANILLLVWFVPQLTRLVERWIPEKTAGEAVIPRLTFITQNLVDTGELNLPEAQNAVRGMARLTKEMFTGFREVFDQPETDLSAKVRALKEMEEQSDRLTSDITHYLVQTSAAEVSDVNARAIGAMTRIVSELEEIADQIYRLVKLTQRRYEDRRHFGPETVKALDGFCDQVDETIDFYIDKLFKPMTLDDIREGDRLEATLDDLKRTLNEEAIKRIQAGGEVRAEMLNIEFNNNLERIGNFALNILSEAYRVQHRDD